MTSSLINVQDEIVKSFQGTLGDGGPAYVRLALALQAAINGGRIPSGAGLPSERLIGEVLGLSRVTIRRALEQLIQGGLLVAKRGSGTFVSSRLVEPMTLLASFSEDMRRRGRLPGSVWLSRELVWPNAEEAMTLAIPSGRRVVRCARTRTADGVPMALEYATVLAEDVGGRSSFGDSLYEAMRRQGVVPVRAIQRVRAENASGAHAELLEISEGGAVFSIERRSFTHDGRPVELTRSIYRGDLYDYVVEISLNPKASDGAKKP
jgi:GntR family transcriptional regulator